MTSPLVSLAFFFLVWNWRTILLLYLNQCSSECHETHHRSKPCSPGLCTWQYLDPSRICEKRVSTYIFQHHHLEKKGGKCQIFLTLVQKMIQQIVHLSFSWGLFFFLRKEMKVDPKKTPLSTAWWREITNSGMCWTSGYTVIHKKRLHRSCFQFILCFSSLVLT